MNPTLTRRPRRRLRVLDLFCCEGGAARGYMDARRATRAAGETLAEVAPRDRHAARVERGGGYVPRSKAVQERLLGIDWMTQHGRQQSLPPVYCEHIGLQLAAHLETEEEAA